MGMTIDEHIAQLKKLKSFHNGSYGASINLAISIMRKYPLMQSKYDKRLKADMAAMLTEIQLEFEELEPEYDCNSYSCGIADCYRTIQEKITSLKEAT